jgi:hypothetical protein
MVEVKGQRQASPSGARAPQPVTFLFPVDSFFMIDLCSLCRIYDNFIAPLAGATPRCDNAKGLGHWHCLPPPGSRRRRAGSAEGHVLQNEARSSCSGVG